MKIRWEFKTWSLVLSLYVELLDFVVKNTTRGVDTAENEPSTKVSVKWGPQTHFPQLQCIRPRFSVVPKGADAPAIDSCQPASHSSTRGTSPLSVSPTLTSNFNNYFSEYFNKLCFCPPFCGPRIIEKITARITNRSAPTTRPPAAE